MLLEETIPSPEDTSGEQRSLRQPLLPVLHKTTRYTLRIILIIYPPAETRTPFERKCRLASKKDLQRTIATSNNPHGPSANQVNKKLGTRARNLESVICHRGYFIARSSLRWVAATTRPLNWFSHLRGNVGTRFRAPEEQNGPIFPSKEISLTTRSGDRSNVVKSSRSIRLYECFSDLQKRDEIEV